MGHGLRLEIDRKKINLYTSYILVLEHLFHQSEVTLYKFGHSYLSIPVNIQAIKYLLCSHPSTESGEQLTCLIIYFIVRYDAIAQHVARCLAFLCHLWLLLHSLHVVHSGNNVGHLRHVDAATVIYIPHSRSSLNSLGFYQIHKTQKRDLRIENINLVFKNLENVKKDPC